MLMLNYVETWRGGGTLDKSILVLVAIYGMWHIMYK